LDYGTGAYDHASRHLHAKVPAKSKASHTAVEKSAFKNVRPTIAKVVRIKHILSSVVQRLPHMKRRKIGAALTQFSDFFVMRVKLLIPCR
jgi:hypothetical protein